MPADEEGASEPTLSVSFEDVFSCDWPESHFDIGFSAHRPVIHAVDKEAFLEEMATWFRNTVSGLLQMDG